MNPTLLVTAAHLYDGNSPDLAEGVTLVVADGLVQEVHTDGKKPAATGRTIDAGQATLIPGLIDAHVHIGAVEVDFGRQAGVHPPSMIAFLMAQRLRHLLDRGYTTVRDCGGADWGFKQAVDQGLIPGPRIIISNRMLSQTGGHGDMRTRAQTGDPCDNHAGFGMVFSIADGVPEVRRAVREQVRMGADFIKVMASGGAASPTDKLDCAQYSEEELRIIVEEAQMAGIYVAAHAIPAISIERAVKAGARTIEHGNFLDDATAALMAQHGTYLVPTIATYVMASRHPERYNDPPEVTAKVNSAAEAALRALEAAHRAGVVIGSGSDLLGEEIAWLNHEHLLKSEVLGAPAALHAATGANAEVLGRADIGVLEAGRRADIVAVAGNPLHDVAVLGDEAGIRLVIKDGEVHRNDL